ncbi:MAG: class I SAM-dependent methyltransferase [Gemmatimonadaceae bacterium]|nr:class I SAM-dependent methyltransferase [Gemmatimonadaceae bacterium]
MSEPGRSNKNPEEARVVEHYRMLWDIHGDSHRSLDWGSAASQKRRFSVLLDEVDLKGRRLLDVGCGLGHLADWLAEQGVSVTYTGLDITPELLKQAAARHPGHRFVQGSVRDADLFAGEQFDIVVSSGLFYTYVDGGLPWMLDTIATLWQWTGGMLAFNSLSAWAPQHTPGEFSADPLRVLEACRQHTTRLRLRHDYHPGDFTMQMRRETSPGDRVDMIVSR